MPKVIPYADHQNAIVVINYPDPLQAGTFEHALPYWIENPLDRSIFYPR